MGKNLTVPRQPFIESQFSMVTDTQDLALDPAIACTVANAVWARNNRSKHLNNSMWSNDTPFIIDTTEFGGSCLPGEVTGYDFETGEPEYSSAFQVHIPNAHLDSDTPVVNRTLAFGFQRLLDREERGTRMGTKGTLAMGSTITAIFAAPEVVIGASAPNGQTLTIMEALLPLGMIALCVGMPFYSVMAQNLIRRAIINPDSKVINRQHMKATVKHVGRLGLDPLLCSA